MIIQGKYPWFENPCLSQLYKSFFSVHLLSNIFLNNTSTLMYCNAF